MKKSLIIFTAIFITGNVCAQVQQTPVENRNTKSNVNTTTLNSNSGVNPNGNPGTIISSSAVSDNVNSPRLTDLNPGANADRIVVQNPSSVPVSTPAPRPVVPVVTQQTETISSNVEGVSPNPPVEVLEVKRVDNPGEPLKVVEIPSTHRPFTPVHATYIPENVVTDIKKKFGENVYDITLVKTESGKLTYIVRIADNGVFRTERINF